MRALQLTTVTATAAALLAVGAAGAMAAPTPVALTHDVPAFTDGTIGTIEWTPAVFSPLSIQRGYQVQVTDTSGADDSVHTTAANDRDQVVTFVNGHRYNLRVRSFERPCIVPLGGVCLAHGAQDFSAFSPSRFTRADATNPTGGVAINAGAEFTNSRDLTLHLNFTDPRVNGFDSSGVSGVQIAQGAGAFPLPLPVAPTRALQLDDGPDGPREVRVRYRDAAVPLTPGLVALPTGNVSTTATDTIFLDRVAPTARVTQSATAVETGVPVSFDSAGSVDGAGGAADSGIDPASIMWNFGDGTTAAGATASKAFATPGVYAGTLTLKDRAGNQASTPFAVNVTAPVPPAPPAQPQPTPPTPSVTGGNADILLSARRVNRAVQGRNVRFRVVVSQRTRVTASVFRRLGNGRLQLVRRATRIAGPGAVVLSVRSPRAGRYIVRLRGGNELVQLPLRVNRR